MKHGTVFLIAAATAFSLLGDQALYAVLPVLFDELGLAAVEVGVLLSANRWIRLLTNELAHRVARRAASRSLFAVALLLGSATTVTYVWTSSFAILLAARLAWGLAWSFIRHLGVGAVMSGVPASDAGQTMGVFNGISRAGSVAGLFGGAVLVDLIGFHRALLVLAAVSLLAIPLAVVGYRDREPSAGELKHAALPWTLVLMGASLGAVGPGFVMSTLGAALELRLESSFAAATSLTGLLLATRYLFDSVAAPLLGGSFDRWGFARCVGLYFGLGGSMLLVASRVPDALHFASCVLGFFVCVTALQAGLAARASRLGSGAYARYVTASDLGSAAGPLVGWAIVGATSRPSVVIGLGGALFILTSAVAPFVRSPGALES
ncbi:MAG: MFS transporter [Acidobacteriota bacterium]